MPKTQGRPWETFNNFECSCHTTMVLQMKVEAVNFRKSQEILLLWFDNFIAKFRNKWREGANRSPPGPNRVKRPQINKVVQVLTGRCNLQGHKKTTGCAASSLCPKCSLEDETPNHHVSTYKLYRDILVKYFVITKTTVHDVVTKCNINKLATYLNESWKAISVRLVTKQNYSNVAATVTMDPNEAYAMRKWTLPNGSRSASTAAHY